MVPIKEKSRERVREVISNLGLINETARATG